MSDDAPSLTRTVEGVELPTPGIFQLDPVHSHIGFVVRHMMVAKVRGRFTAVDGTITVAEDPAASSVDVSVDLASVDTREEQRDGHLRSPDFFDVEQHPTMTFRSTRIVPKGRNDLTVEGELTVRGVTRPLTLDATYEGVAGDPWGGQRIGFSAEGEVDREEFGLTWNMALETGGVLVGKKARLEIEVEAVRQP